MYVGNNPVNYVDPTGHSKVAKDSGNEQAGGLSEKNWTEYENCQYWGQVGPNGEWQLPLGCELYFDELAAENGAGSNDGWLMLLGFMIDMSMDVDPSGDGGDNLMDNAAHSAMNRLNLQKALAVEAQMAEVGTIMAGPGGRTAFRNAPRVAQQYGGSPDDWVKKTSSSYTAADGTTFETHWVENIHTGQRVEFKVKFLDPNE